MAANTALLSAPTEHGFLLRIVGRGTFTESPAFRDFVSRCLDMEGKPQVVIDVSQCEYLDSTFMGCLIWLHKHAESGSRLQFFASPEKCRELFAFCMLDRVLNITRDCPQPTDEFVVLSMVDIEDNELGRHIAQCHKRLAELGTKEAARLQSVAERLSRELGGDLGN